jgi:C_GCAxxG_C_C family probable redox protein
MTKEEVVRSFQSGFDCGQTVLRHCAAALGLDEKTAGRISTGFGGGSGRGETCGAVIGAYLALGLKYGCDETGEAGAEQKVRWMKKNAEFCEKFQAKYPGFTCREILGVDLSTPEGRKQNQERQLTANLCPQLVADVTAWLDEILAED